MLVMRMLGEMSAAYPSSGSFSAHAERAIGPWAGFTAGWSFWVLLCTAVGLEGIGAAKIVTGWLPGTPEWAWVALFMVALLCHEPRRGEELRRVRVLVRRAEGRRDHAVPGARRAGDRRCSAGHGLPRPREPHGEGGFLPNGGEGLVIGLLASVFAYGGLETVTIAAAESQDPVRGVASAVRTAMWRIALFYIGSMAVIVTLVPWDSKAVVEKGPYVAALDAAGHPGRRAS